MIIWSNYWMNKKKKIQYNSINTRSQSFVEKKHLIFKKKIIDILRESCIFTS